MSEYSLNLKRFNMQDIPDGAICTFIGKRKSGKSYCLKDLLYNKKDMPIGKIVSGTEEASPFFGDFFPKSFIDFEFEERNIAKLIKRQKDLLTKMKREPQKYGQADPRMLIVLDDCLYDDSWAKTTPIRNIFMNGRHFKIFFVVTMQYVLGIPPVLRTNIDYTFIFREPSIGNRKRIYDNFCGMIPTFNMFCQVMDSLEQYECLVVCNDADKIKLEEQVYWYKAKDNGDFKFGGDQMWRNDEKIQNFKKNKGQQGRSVDGYRPTKRGGINLKINKYQ